MPAPRILLVEDDPDSAEAMRLLLGAHGVETEWAATAGEALVRFESDARPAYNALMLDIMLPDMSGPELIERLRRVADLPPVLIHSAATRAITSRAGVATRAVAVLRKPVTWEQIRQALERCGIRLEVPST